MVFRICTYCLGNTDIAFLLFPLPHNLNIKPTIALASHSSPDHTEQIQVLKTCSHSQQKTKQTGEQILPRETILEGTKIRVSGYNTNSTGHKTHRHLPSLCRLPVALPIRGGGDILKQNCTLISLCYEFMADIFLRTLEMWCPIPSIFQRDLNVYLPSGLQEKCQPTRLKQH